MTVQDLRSRVGAAGSTAPAKMQIKKPATDISPPDYDKMKDVFKKYDGFGMLSLVRALSGRGWRSSRLALLGGALLVGQWVGPVGYVAHKLAGEDMKICPGDASIWARLAMGSVSLVYFARLSLKTLSYDNKTPVEIVRCNMPEWWSTYEQADRVLTALLYDTIIALVNLFIVFQDGAIDDMIVDVLALGFFTLLDDEFKAAILEYDGNLLTDLTSDHHKPVKLPCPQHPPSLPGPAHASNGTPRANGNGSLTAPLVHGVESTGNDNIGNIPPNEGLGKPCASGGACMKLNAGFSPAWKAVVASANVALKMIAATCRYGGPLCAFLMVFYGPICVGGGSSAESGYD